MLGLGATISPGPNSVGLRGKIRLLGAQIVRWPGARAAGEGSGRMWDPVARPGSLTDRIVSQVEALIGDESLKPGDRLPSERELAVLLNVSRPSVREAVRMLEARGRLAVRHGQGVFVLQRPTERELRRALRDTDVTMNEIFAMREVLEVPAGCWAAERITAAQLADLRATLDHMSNLIDAPATPIDALADLDATFHLGVAAAAGNRFLAQTSGVLTELLLSGMETTLRIPGRPEQSRRDHEAIYAALAAHDPPAVRRAVRAHIRAAHAAALRRVVAAERDSLAASPAAPAPASAAS